MYHESCGKIILAAGKTHESHVLPGKARPLMAQEGGGGRWRLEKIDKEYPKLVEHGINSKSYRFMR